MRTLRLALAALAVLTLATPATAELAPQKVVVTDGTENVLVNADGSLSCTIAASSEIQANQGDPAADADAWPTKVCNGSGDCAPVDPTNGLKVDATVSEAAPTNPAVQLASTTAIAANGGTANLNSTDITSGTKKLRRILVSCTTQAKLEVRKVENGSAGSVLLVARTSNVVPTVTIDPPHANFLTITNSVGADNFRVVVTNLEPAGGSTADCDATFFINE